MDDKYNSDKAKYWDIHDQNEKRNYIIFVQGLIQKREERKAEQS